MTVGERLQSYRKQHNLSQEELAKQLFVTRQTISLWETDQTLPTIDNLVRLKDILEVSIDDILTGPQDKPEEENQPLESYEFQYSKPILKSVSKTVNLNTMRVYTIVLSMLIINAIRTDFVLIGKFSLGVSFTLLIFFGLLYIFTLISIRKKWNPKNPLIYKNKYIYNVYTDHIMITMVKDNTVISTKRVTPDVISRCWSTTDLYIFQISNEIYCIKKHVLDSNSALHRFYSIAQHRQKKGNGTISKTFEIVSLVIFILTLFCFPIAFIIISAIWEYGAWFNEYAWIMYLFLPIPFASIILGVISTNKGVKNNKSIIAGVITAFLLIAYGSLVFLEKPENQYDEEYYDEIQESLDQNFLSEIEYQTKVELPASSVLIDWDYSSIYNDEVYWEGQNIYMGNSSAIISFSNNDARLFEKDILKSNSWMNEITADFAKILPSNTEEIFVDADYHLIYNIDNTTYNTVPNKDGEYWFFYLYYYSDENILRAIKYKKYLGANDAVYAPKTVDVVSNDDGTYSMIVYRNDGEIIKMYTDLKIDPLTKMINGRYLKATTQSPEGLYKSWTEYYDLQTGEISKRYYSVLTEFEDKVIYVEKEQGNHYLVVSNLLYEDVYYKRTLLENSSDVNDPISLFGITDGILRLTYLKGENKEEATITIDLDKTEIKKESKESVRQVTITE